VPAEFCGGERVSLGRILAEIVTIPAPLVTPKAAGLRAQSLPRCKRLWAVIAYHYG
jgi:hypothetical protein